MEDYVKAFSGLDMILISGEVIVVINKERAGHVLPERLIIVPEYCQEGTGHRSIVCLFVCLFVCLLVCSFVFGILVRYHTQQDNKNIISMK